jgi:hypothetical protein
LGKSINTLFLVEDAAWTIKLRRWARLRIWIVAGVSLLLLLQNGATGAQEFDPLLGYLLAADGKSLGLGGDLSVIRPLPLRLPSGGDNPSARELFRLLQTRGIGNNGRILWAQLSGERFHLW